MDLQIDGVWLTGFLLASVRAAAWVMVCPPFNSPAVNNRVKVALAVALGLVLAGGFDGQSLVTADVWTFIVAIIEQVAIGLALGFGVLILFSAVQAAGEMIDLSVGFSGATLFDPFSGAAASPIGRLYQVLAIAVLFAINGHLMLVKGFMASFMIDPSGGFSIGDVTRTVVHDVSTFFLAAIQIAFPLLAALLITEIILGLMSKASPQMNVLAFGFALKIGVALLLLGLAIRVIPSSVTDLLGRGLESMASMITG